MNFRDHAAIGAMQALIIAETWTPSVKYGDHRPTRPAPSAIAGSAWAYAQALNDAQPYMGEAAPPPVPPELVRGFVARGAGEEAIQLFLTDNEARVLIDCLASAVDGSKAHRIRTMLIDALRGGEPPEPTVKGVGEVEMVPLQKALAALDYVGAANYPTRIREAEDSLRRNAVMVPREPPAPEPYSKRPNHEAFD